jgi:copper chaperone CopZ
MKQIVIIVLGLFLLTSCAESTKTRFYVEGNCMECKEIIEAKVNEIQGIDSVGWDFESSLLIVKYFASKVAPDMIQQHVAKAGFDTQFYPADTDARNQLPACCQEPINRKLKRYEPEFKLNH